jgi:sugar (pentulose or hexulose) kinase
MPEPALLALDLGTTHCKAALFSLDGSCLASASEPSAARQDPEGYVFYDPQAVWRSAAAVLRVVVQSPASADFFPACLGVTSMAETGLLLDRSSGAAATPFFAWHDRSSTAQAHRLASLPEADELFLRRGTYASYKSSAAKLLWLKENGFTLDSRYVWLSSADYVVYRLCGALVTDYSLAVRTYALHLDDKSWDIEWLLSMGLEPDLFPELLPSGSIAGRLSQAAARESGLPVGLPCAVAGHDHVCGAMAVSAVDPGLVFNSMGTAESLVGALYDRPLGRLDQQTGLVFGLHVVPGRRYWMGGLSASGGSVEWLRGLLGEPPPSYSELEALLEQSPPSPTGILYFPYLAGSGSPHTDLFVRGAFIGLDASHGRPHLARAVLEGAAFELEVIRQAAEKISSQPVKVLTAAGGGTRSRTWMQVKADVSGCRIEAQSMPETSLLGAALLAGVGAGLYPDHAAALASLSPAPPEVYLPDPDRCAAYQRLFAQGYLPLQEPLRQWGRRSPMAC